MRSSPVHGPSSERGRRSSRESQRFTLTYVWLGLTILQSVLVYQAVEKQRGDRARRLDRIARWALPASYYGAYLVLVFSFS